MAPLAENSQMILRMKNYNKKAYSNNWLEKLKKASNSTTKFFFNSTPVSNTKNKILIQANKNSFEFNYNKKVHFSLHPYENVMVTIGED